MLDLNHHIPLKYSLEPNLKASDAVAAINARNSRCLIQNRVSLSEVKEHCRKIRSGNSKPEYLYLFRVEHAKSNESKDLQVVNPYDFATLEKCASRVVLYRMSVMNFDDQVKKGILVVDKKTDTNITLKSLVGADMGWMLGSFLATKNPTAHLIFNDVGLNSNLPIGGIILLISVLVSYWEYWKQASELSKSLGNKKLTKEELEPLINKARAAAFEVGLGMVGYCAMTYFVNKAFAALIVGGIGSTPPGWAILMAVGLIYGVGEAVGVVLAKIAVCRLQHQAINYAALTATFFAFAIGGMCWYILNQVPGMDVMASLAKPWLELVSNLIATLITGLATYVSLKIGQAFGMFGESEKTSHQIQQDSKSAVEPGETKPLRRDDGDSTDREVKRISSPRVRHPDDVPIDRYGPSPSPIAAG